MPWLGYCHRAIIQTLSCETIKCLLITNLKKTIKAFDREYRKHTTEVGTLILMISTLPL